MKKIVWGFFGLLLIGIVLFNNPVEGFWADISELYFDESGKWYLELELGTADPQFQLPIDSICISSLAGVSKIKNINFIDSTSYKVITSDSLVSPLTINQSGDSLTLILYPGDLISFKRKDMLVFGNRSGSIIDSVNSGYSITCINKKYYTKDNTPTLGFPNDTCGVCATLTGFVYDKNQNIVIDTNLVLTYTLFFDETGRYTTKVLSRKYGFTQIALWRSSYKVFLQSTLGAPIDYLNITNVNFNSNPGDVIERNIYLTDYVSGTERIESENIEKQLKSSTTPTLSTPQLIFI